MTPEKRAELQARGYIVSDDIGDILGMTEADRRIVEFRTELSRRVRELRNGRGLTQAQLAAIVGISQSRLPGIESGTASLDTIAAVVVALGGSLTFNPPQRPAGKPARPRGMARRKRTRNQPAEADIEVTTG